MKPIIAVPCIIAIVYRAYSRRSLTPVGLLVATLTAILHALHPFSLPFALLGAFFLAGTAVTKVKHDIKARLTQSASGASGGEGARTHVQVLANSAIATVLTLLHAYALLRRDGGEHTGQELCFHRPHRNRHAADVLLVGVVANYAAVAADTFSSELGILASGAPRLITAPWRVVARGTNGGVTATGLLAGLGGGAVIAAVTGLLMPFCAGLGEEEAGLRKAGSRTRAIPGLGSLEEVSWDWDGKMSFIVAMALVGLVGSVLDSLLGAVLQASVVDVRSGKVVEGNGGQKVLVSVGGPWADGAAKSSSVSTSSSTGQTASRKPGGREGKPDGAEEKHHSRRIETGWDVLDNNGVNLLMAASTSLLAMLAACMVWNVPLPAVLHSILA